MLSFSRITHGNQFTHFTQILFRFYAFTQTYGGPLDFHRVKKIPFFFLKRVHQDAETRKGQQHVQV